MLVHVCVCLCVCVFACVHACVVCVYATSDTTGCIRTCGVICASGCMYTMCGALESCIHDFFWQSVCMSARLCVCVFMC